ncbi:MAG TPA: helix-turn-helix domain-containing protein [Usitatibacter sp.]
MQAEVQTAEDGSRKSLGQMLAAERERQGLSRADAAQRLHMSAYQVEALETGDYSRLPKGTFLRGFVRNYAKVLGLQADAVMPLLTEDAPSHGRPGIVVPTQNIRFDPLGDRLQNPYVKAAVLAVVVVSLAFAAMYWWVSVRPTAFSHKDGDSSPVVADSQAEPVPVTVAAAPPPPEVVEPPKPEPVKAEPAKADARKPDAKKADPVKPDVIKVAAAVAAPADAAVKMPVKAPAEGGSVLKFRFHGDSWVEIRDAKGRVLLSRLNTAGSEAEVAGRPPFSVIVGNAPEVRLFYNDHEFDLEPHTRVAVARFTVE